MFSSSSDAALAYDKVSNSYNVWELYRGDDLFVIYPYNSESESLIKATNQADFVPFSETYPEEWNLINKLPANPPEKVVGAGFIKTTDKLKRWLPNIISDKDTVNQIIDFIEKTGIKSIAVGLYSQAGLSLVSKGNLKDCELSLLLIGDSSYLDIGLSIVSLFFPSKGMTKQNIDGDIVYEMPLGNAYLMLKNIGSNIYISIATDLEDAQGLLDVVLQEQKADFSTSIALISDLKIDKESAFRLLLLTGIVVLIFYIGATFFNSTLKEEGNYVIIRSRLSKISRTLKLLNLSKLNINLRWFLIVVICAAIYWWLNPYFTNGLKGIALYVSLIISITIATLAYDGAIFLAARRLKIATEIQIFPFTLMTALACVSLSRFINFRPGLFYGFVGTNTVTQSSTEKYGKAVLCGVFAILIISISVFFLREYFHNRQGEEGNFWWYLIDYILVGIFTIGLEGLIFSLVPLKFFDGHKIKELNCVAWLLIFIVTIFAFLYIIVYKGENKEHILGDAKAYSVLAFVSLFAILGFLTWAYFKWWHKPMSRKIDDTSTSSPRK